MAQVGFCRQVKIHNQNVVGQLFRNGVGFRRNQHKAHERFREGIGVILEKSCRHWKQTKMWASALHDDICRAFFIIKPGRCVTGVFPDFKSQDAAQRLIKIAYRGIRVNRNSYGAVLSGKDFPAVHIVPDEHRHIVSRPHRLDGLYSSARFTARRKYDTHRAGEHVVQFLNVFFL